MSGQIPVVGWKEVRNQELSEIITRRVAVGSLTPAAVTGLTERWTREGLLPTAQAWKAEQLAGVLIEWLDAYSLRPGPVAEFVKLRSAAGLLPVAAGRLTAEEISVALVGTESKPPAGRLAPLVALFRPGPAGEPGAGRESLVKEVTVVLEAVRDMLLRPDAQAPDEDKELASGQEVGDREWRGAEPGGAAPGAEALLLRALVLEALLRREVSGDLVGLALSGGGIRSASFNLGLLQSLQQYDLLREVDFLSTVSGGGYVGSLLSSLVYNGNTGPGSGHETLARSLAPDANGKQPERVVKLVRSGSYLNNPILHLSRYLTGVFLNNLVIFSALLAACTAAALLWRCLDLYPVAQWLRYYSGGWITDGTRPFLPALVLITGWLSISSLYLIVIGSGGQSRFAKGLLQWGVGPALLIGAAVWLATPHMEMPVLTLQAPEVQPHVLSLGNAPLLILLGLALLGILPFLRPRTFLLSGCQPNPGPAARVAFKVLSLALLVGMPFFLVYFLARHNIAAQSVSLVPGFDLEKDKERDDSIRRWQLHETDIQSMRWASFWNHLLEEQKTPGNVGFHVWTRLTEGTKATVRETVAAGGPLFDQIRTVDIPLPQHAEAQAKKQAIIKDFNDKVLADEKLADDLLGASPEGKAAVTGPFLQERQAHMHEGHRLHSLLERRDQHRLLPADKRELNRLLLEAYYGWAIYQRAVVRRSPTIAQDQLFRLEVFGFAAGLAVLASCVVRLNATSLHGIYRQQLAHVYVEPVGADTPDIPLDRLNTTEKGTPYHLLSGALNKGSLRQEAARPTTLFLFSRRFCGSVFTGFAPSEAYQGGVLDLATAMAISGAAFSPARVHNRLIAFLMVVLNARLGQWLPSPRHPGRVRYLPMLRLLASLCLYRGVEERRYWFISDGGHCENLGLGPLLRRECRLMIVSDAGHDPDYGFDDFVHLYRNARIQGVRFRTLDQHGFIRLDGLVPDKATGNCPHRYVIARVDYPGPGNKWGLLIYVKPSFTGDESVDLARYRKVNTAFPHDPTVNQWFDEEQVESYRELGAWIGERACQRLLSELFRQRREHLDDFDAVLEWLTGHLPERPGELGDRMSALFRQIEELRADVSSRGGNGAASPKGVPGPA
jgi:hypothetical protein